MPWETLPLPLYTIWTTGTIATKAFAVAHCTLGDLCIAAVTILAALVVIGLDAWPLRGFRQVFLFTVVLGIVYAIYSEWLNTTVRQSWAYSPLMPVVPRLGIGLSPLLQWLVVPSLALNLTGRQRRT